MPHKTVPFLIARIPDKYVATQEINMTKTFKRCVKKATFEP